MYAIRIPSIHVLVASTLLETALASSGAAATSTFSTSVCTSDAALVSGAETSAETVTDSVTSVLSVFAVGFSTLAGSPGGEGSHRPLPLQRLQAREWQTDRHSTPSPPVSSPPSPSRVPRASPNLTCRPCAHSPPRSRSRCPPSRFKLGRSESSS
ncbi:uncharacterized protein LAESUDRAFT_370036 [Laetiporus sulphureus 93-53]|uniref:REJ domain-containing protein n=1 Tax=Laetiporus sulphureus 93-53 TaxID=1314785 RepID=A0A165CUM4_9APHY|nr:uncharacterized protein LAESUDRAFT_370036 [Laetiporus sulphureus 93-53]KZT03459.1 hypothetical protein LAESUDRAFT_370036 [Laetiporus sulphureus 93-53]